MSALRRFIYDNQQPVVIDGTGLRPDPELMERNQARARDAIQRMGKKWCCYQDKRTFDQICDGVEEEQ